MKSNCVVNGFLDRNENVSLFTNNAALAPIVHHKTTLGIMISAPRYFLLVMGRPNASPQKFWTQEEIFSALSDRWTEALNAEHLAITTDSGSDIYSKDEILRIIRARKDNRFSIPILALLFLSILIVPQPWVRVSWTLFFLVFVRSLVITTSGVCTSNRALFRNFFTKK